MTTVNDIRIVMMPCYLISCLFSSLGQGSFLSLSLSLSLFLSFSLFFRWFPAVPCNNITSCGASLPRFFKPLTTPSVFHYDNYASANDINYYSTYYLVILSNHVPCSFNYQFGSFQWVVRDDFFFSTFINIFCCC